MIAERIVAGRRGKLIVKFMEDDDDGKDEIRELFLPSKEPRVIRLIIVKAKVVRKVYFFRRVCRGGKDDQFVRIQGVRKKNRINIKIPLYNGSGKVYTRYPENCVNLFCVSPGRVRMYQYSLVGRQGKLFLIKQLLFEGDVFSDGSVFLPETPWLDLKPWKEILENEIIRKALKSQGIKEALQCEKRSFSPLLLPSGKKAMVLWFNAAMGYGYAIINKNGRTVYSIRLHWSKIGARLFFRPGEIVSYDGINLHYSSHNGGKIIKQLVGVQAG